MTKDEIRYIEGMISVLQSTGDQLIRNLDTLADPNSLDVRQIRIATREIVLRTEQMTLLLYTYKQREES